MKRQKLDHEPQEVATGAAADHAAQEEAFEAKLVEREMGLPFEFEKKYENEIDYRNKLVLAPMVRTGSCKFIHLFQHLGRELMIVPMVRLSFWSIIAILMSSVSCPCIMVLAWYGHRK
jgi:hypothetical protein